MRENLPPGSRLWMGELCIHCEWAVSICIHCEWIDCVSPENLFEQCNGRRRFSAEIGLKASESSQRFNWEHSKSEKCFSVDFGTKAHLSLSGSERRCFSAEIGLKTTSESVHQVSASIQSTLIEMRSKSTKQLKSALQFRALFQVNWNAFQVNKAERSIELICNPSQQSVQVSASTQSTLSSQLKCIPSQQIALVWVSALKRIFLNKVCAVELFHQSAPSFLCQHCFRTLFQVDWYANNAARPSWQSLRRARVENVALRAIFALKQVASQHCAFVCTYLFLTRS